MLGLIGNAIFLFVLYMIYRDVEDRHYKSLQEQVEKFHAANVELMDFKERYYNLKEENRRLEKELEKFKYEKDIIDKRQKESKVEVKRFPPEDPISF